jgi:hypothetical protein
MALHTECTAHTAAYCGFAFANSVNKSHHYVQAFWAVCVSTHKTIKHLHMIHKKYQHFLTMLCTAMYSFKPFILQQTLRCLPICSSQHGFKYMNKGMDFHKNWNEHRDLEVK